jgi:hypothetical protein
MAVEGVRAGPIRVTDIVGAGIAVGAVGVDLLAGSVVAFDAAIDAAGAIGVVIDANVVLAALAPGTFVIRATAVRRNTGVAGAALRGGIFAAGIRAVGDWAAGGFAAPSRAATLVVIGKAAFVLGFAEDERIFAAEFFAIAVPETTFVVAALAVSRRVRNRNAAGAAGGAAFVRSRGRAGACPSWTWNLIPWTGGWLRRGCGTPGGFDIVLTQRTADDCRSAKPKQSFEHVAPAGTGS